MFFAFGCKVVVLGQCVVCGLEEVFAVMKDDDVFLCHDDIWKHTKE